MATLGESVRAARKDHQLSLSQLSRATGLSKGFLSQIETGTSNPSLGSLEKIAAALGVSTLRLIPGGAMISANPLLPDKPRMLGVAHSRKREGNIEVLTASEAGTHLLVEIPPEVELYAVGGTSMVVLAIVLEGSVLVSQSEELLQLAVGAVGTWNSGGSYTITTLRGRTSRLVLFVPQSLPLPTLRPSQPEQLIQTGAKAFRLVESTRGNTSRAIDGRTDGPMRLVEMRAQRLAGRKPSP